MHIWIYFQSSIMRGIGAGTRIFDLLDRKPAIPPDAGITLNHARRGIVKFENIRFEYPSRQGVEILKDLNFEIGIGESVAVVYVVFLSCTLACRINPLISAEGVEVERRPFIPCFCDIMIR